MHPQSSLSIQHLHSLITLTSCDCHIPSSYLFISLSFKAKPYPKIVRIHFHPFLSSLYLWNTFKLVFSSSLFQQSNSWQSHFLGDINFIACNTTYKDNSAQIYRLAYTSTLNSRLEHPTANLTHALECLGGLPNFFSSVSLFCKWQFHPSSCSNQKPQSHSWVLFLTLTFNPPANLVRYAFKIYLQSSHFLLITLISPILSHLDYVIAPNSSPRFHPCLPSYNSWSNSLKTSCNISSLLRIPKSVPHQRHHNGLQDPTTSTPPLPPPWTHLWQLSPVLYSTTPPVKREPLTREVSSAWSVPPCGYMHAHSLTSFTSLSPSQRGLVYFQLYWSLSPILLVHWFIFCLFHCNVM